MPPTQASQTRSPSARAATALLVLLLTIGGHSGAGAGPADTVSPVSLYLVQPDGTCAAAPVLARTTDAGGACGPIASIDHDVVAATVDGAPLTLDASQPLRGTVTLVPYTRVQVDQLELGVGAGLTRAAVTLRATVHDSGLVVELGRATMEQLTTPLDPVATLEFSMPLAQGLDRVAVDRIELSISLEGATALNWFVAADGRTATTVWTHPATTTTTGSCDGLAATILGTDDPEELVGTDGPDVIVGLGGDDRIDGGGGDDVICGGDGDDTIVGGPGSDLILGELGDDLLDGGDGADHIDGGNGMDTVLGGPGDDRLFGGSNDDLIDGGDGADRMFGERGSDDLFGGPGADYLKGGQDGDQLAGGPGDDRVIGDGSADILRGDAGDDHLDAGEGDDRLEGGPGEDDLDGGAGFDTGDGGADTDACRAIEVEAGCEAG